MATSGSRVEYRLYKGGVLHVVDELFERHICVGVREIRLPFHHVCVEVRGCSAARNAYNAPWASNRSFSSNPRFENKDSSDKSIRGTAWCRSTTANFPFAMLSWILDPRSTRDTNWLAS